MTGETGVEALKQGLELRKQRATERLWEEAHGRFKFSWRQEGLMLLWCVPAAAALARRYEEPTGWIYGGLLLFVLIAFFVGRMQRRINALTALLEQTQGRPR